MKKETEDMEADKKSADEKGSTKFEKYFNSILGFGYFAFFVIFGIYIASKYTGFEALIRVLCGIFAGSCCLYAALSQIKPTPRKPAPKEKVFKANWFDKLPYFGDKMDRLKVMGIIKDLKFSSYKTDGGELLQEVQISEDEKWVRILGSYLPTDLICGYNRTENVIYSIDGTAIMLPKVARNIPVQRDIEEFFEDRGIWYATMPKNAEYRYQSSRKFYSFWQDNKIDKENFGKLRYMWEKAVANDINGYWRHNRNSVKYHPVKKNEIDGELFFERVLSDGEIKKTMEAVNSGKIDLSNYLNFEDYKNEFSVCNCIELLKYLSYPKNKEGIDFLFECLGDVDEAYFTYAIKVLHQYPGQMLYAKIEEYVKHAFETGDVVHLAGVMFLANDINYKIRYIENMKKEEEKSKRKSKEIQEFNFDEVAAFGSEEVQEFTADGVAYQKQPL